MAGSERISIFLKKQNNVINIVPQFKKHFNTFSAINFQFEFFMIFSQASLTHTCIITYNSSEKRAAIVIGGGL